MKYNRVISAFVLVITLLAIVASVSGILTLGKMSTFDFTTVHGQVVKIYGGGLYKYNSVGQVYQAIPHDFVTLLLAIPALIVSFVLTRKGSLKGKLFLTGIVAYIFITYFMYTFIAMYNRLFIVYILLTSFSFYTLLLLLLGWKENVKQCVTSIYPNKFIGTFLMIASVLTALVWLKEPLATLFTGSIPVGILEQGSTMPVQAIDLAFFLPITFVMGAMLRKGEPIGYIGGTIASVGLMFIMTAIVSKGVSLKLAGFSGVIPLIICMGIIDIFAIICTIITFKNIRECIIER